MIPAIDGKTRVCGLIGNPIEHTLSPVLHNYLAKRMGHDLIYVPFLVETNTEAAVKGAFALNILGMNVTVPYKKAVIPYLVEIDDNARMIGSVNTLVRAVNGYKGYNTDYLGLRRAMMEEGISLKNNSVIILGAGGAAMSVAFLCAVEQARSIRLLNRTIEKGEQIVASIRDNFPGIDILAVATQSYYTLPKQSYIVIQTTSVGMYPDSEAVLIEDQEFYKNIGKAMDMIYNPAETMFMKLVKEHGGYACNGMKMLLYQGIAAYELWNEVSIDQDLAEETCKLLEKYHYDYNSE